MTGTDGPAANPSPSSGPDSGSGGGSWRVRPLPANWEELRQACFARDGYRCQHVLGHNGPNGSRPLICGSAYAIECDHVDRNGGDDLDNLQTLCRPHHKIKSSGEGGRAAGALRTAIAAAKVRPSKPHPGLRKDT